MSCQFYYYSVKVIVYFGFLKIFESIMPFIRFGKFVAVLLLPLRSPLGCLIWISNLPHLKENFWLSPQNLVFSKSPQLSRKHHIYPIAQYKNLRVFLSSSLPFTSPSNPSTHLSKCILNSPIPTLLIRPPSPESAPLISYIDFLCRSLLTGLSAV